MKKILFLLATMMLVFNISCRKDDVSEASVQGNWKADKATINGTITYNGLPVPFSQTKDNACTKQSALTLNADNSGSMVIKDDTSGVCEALEQGNFTYQYNSGTKIITVTSNGTSETLKVTNLTSTEMTVEKNVDYSSPDGSFAGKITIYFKK